MSFRLFSAVMELVYRLDHRLTGAYYRPSAFGLVLAIVLLLAASPAILLAKLAESIRRR